MFAQESELFFKDVYLCSPREWMLLLECACMLAPESECFCNSVHLYSPRECILLLECKYILALEDHVFSKGCAPNILDSEWILS